MPTTDTVVVGAGQAGLAVSWHLARQGRDHVVLERGRTAERWRSARWDSLRTLTPNWMSRLPGRSYDGPDPDGYMAATQVATYLDRYATSFAAPVVEQAAVRRVVASGDGYEVATDAGTWWARNVVLATGWCDQPRIPATARALDGVAQLGAAGYRNPGLLPDGGVLVVGASASGVQIADELARAGRDVTLAVGRHSRAPRRYAGRDVLAWFEDLGLLDRGPEPGVDRRFEPSTQLVGRPDRSDLDLGTLGDLGVRLVGHVVGAEAGVVRTADDLTDTMSDAERRLHRLLDAVDALLPAGARPERPGPLDPPPVPTRLDLRAEGIAAVVWATGYRRSYPWLHVPVLDERGEICHRAGVTPAPGLYVVGTPFQTRRRSAWLDGVRFDAALVAGHLAERHLPAVLRRPHPTRPARTDLVAPAAAGAAVLAS